MPDFDLTGELSLKIELHMLRPITEKVHSGNGPVSLVQCSWQLQDQPIRFDHFRVEFCPILDKMTIYSSLHLYSIKSSAKYLKIFHCRERMAWIEVWLKKSWKFFYFLLYRNNPKWWTHMYRLNPTTQSQIRVALMLRSIVATQNSAIT